MSDTLRSAERVGTITDELNGDEATDDLVVHTQPHDGGLVVSVEGDVDLFTCKTLQRALEAACSAPPRDRDGVVVVDLRRAPFIDSAGLALLVGMRTRFADRCRLVLRVARGGQVERVLKMGRFDTFLRVVHTLEELDAGGVA